MADVFGAYLQRAEQIGRGLHPAQMVMDYSSQEKLLKETILSLVKVCRAFKSEVGRDAQQVRESGVVGRV